MGKLGRDMKRGSWKEIAESVGAEKNFDPEEILNSLPRSRSVSPDTQMDSVKTDEGETSIGDEKRKQTVISGSKSAGVKGSGWIAAAEGLSSLGDVLANRDPLAKRDYWSALRESLVPQEPEPIYGVAKEDVSKISPLISQYDALVRDAWDIRKSWEAVKNIDPAKSTTASDTVLTAALENILSMRVRGDVEGFSDRQSVLKQLQNLFERALKDRDETLAKNTRKDIINAIRNTYRQFRDASVFQSELKKNQAIELVGGGRYKPETFDKLFPVPFPKVYKVKDPDGFEVEFESEEKKRAYEKKLAEIGGGK